MNYLNSILAEQFDDKDYKTYYVSDNRFEERMTRLYGKTSACTQVQVPLLELETMKSAARHEPPGGISLVFTKEENRHKPVEPTSLDRITEENKSINNSTLILGTIFSNKRFSSHDSVGKVQSDTKTDDYSKTVVFRTALDVRMASPVESVESAQTYKIKESNAVEDLKLKENIDNPSECIRCGDNASETSLAKLPEHLFREPNFDIFSSRSDNETSPCIEYPNSSKEIDSISVYDAQKKPSVIKSSEVIIVDNSSVLKSDENTIMAGDSDFAAFINSDNTLQPEVSHASSLFNPGNIHCLGNIYQENILSKDSVKTINNRSNESNFAFVERKDSVINVVKDYGCSSKVMENTSRISANKTLCSDIVQGLVNRSVKGEENSGDDSH